VTFVMAEGRGQGMPRCAATLAVPFAMTRERQAGGAASMTFAFATTTTLDPGVCLSWSMSGSTDCDLAVSYEPGRWIRYSYIAVNSSSSIFPIGRQGICLPSSWPVGSTPLRIVEMNSLSFHSLTRLKPGPIGGS
jgi:hypothetical protein